jgi:hypothetical protein
VVSYLRRFLVHGKKGRLSAVQWYNAGMNERTKRAIEATERMLGCKLSAEEREECEQLLLECERNGTFERWAEEAASPSKPWNELSIFAFARKLKSRQGTTMPDFDALHKKKAAIDDKFLNQ